MYASIAMLVLTTVGGGFYKFTIEPLKKQLQEQQLVIMEQSRQIGELTKQMENVTMINTALKSENDLLMGKLKELGRKLEEEKAKNNLLEMGLKEAKAANARMSIVLEQQNRRVRELQAKQKKSKVEMDRAIKSARSRAEAWKEKYLSISSKARKLPIEDCGQAEYLYDEYHKSRVSQ
jgi:chromosome segregation ATPase